MRETRSSVGAPRMGLVLSGGAARGAYQAGVLRFLYRSLPKNLGFVPWPAVVSGTSVGALNGTFVVSRSEAQIVLLSRLWRRLRIPDVFTLQYGDVLGALRGRHRGHSGAALLDPSPLVRLVHDQFPQTDVRRSIDSGAVRAFIVSATELNNGHNVLFVDSAADDLGLLPLARSRVERTPIGPQEVLASAALPFMFPPVTLRGRGYVDGGLRQNTPLRPVLHSGVDRVLVVGSHMASETGPAPQTEVVPSLAFLAGKTLNALMADPVDRDLAQAERLNAVVAWGTARYGPEFAEGVARDLDLRAVSILTVRPSQDLGRIAAKAYKDSPPADAPNLRWLLSALADRQNAEGGESDLLSYLYFDRAFTEQLEDLGYQDAEAQQEQLAAHFLGEAAR
jgi:NTE family protein